MKKGDPNYLSLYPHVNEELFKPLRWSYDNFSNPILKSCFIYHAMFPKDAEINLQLLNFSL